MNSSQRTTDPPPHGGITMRVADWSNPSRSLPILELIRSEIRGTLLNKLLNLIDEGIHESLAELFPTPATLRGVWSSVAFRRSQTASARRCLCPG